MTTPIVTINDPCAMVLEAAGRIWGDVHAVVQYEEGLEDRDLDWSTAEDTDGRNIIYLNPNLSVLDTATALAEAITRLKVGNDVDLEDELYKTMLDKLIHTYSDIDGRKSYLH